MIRIYENTENVVNSNRASLRLRTVGIITVGLLAAGCAGDKNPSPYQTMTPTADTQPSRTLTSALHCISTGLHATHNLGNHSVRIDYAPVLQEGVGTDKMRELLYVGKIGQPSMPVAVHDQLATDTTFVEQQQDVVVAPGASTIVEAVIFDFLDGPAPTDEQLMSGVFATDGALASVCPQAVIPNTP